MPRNQTRLKKAIVLGTLASTILVGFAELSSRTTVAASALHPCPGIYYKESFNSTRIVPQGCPPNAATQQVTMVS